MLDRDAMSGRVAAVPTREQIDTQVNEALIVELPDPKPIFPRIDKSQYLGDTKAPEPKAKPAKSAKGEIIKNVQRQPRVSINNPPTDGPAI